MIQETAPVGIILGPYDPFRPIVNGARLSILRLVEDGSVRRSVEMQALRARLAVRAAHEIRMTRRHPTRHGRDERFGHLHDADGADISDGHLVDWLLFCVV